VSAQHPGNDLRNVIKHPAYVEAAVRIATLWGCDLRWFRSGQ
jgi:hypothetical protein